MDQAPETAAAAEEAPPPAPMDPVEAARVLKRFIRCRPGRPANYCNGTGVVTALVNRERVKRLCACIENAVRAQKEREASHAALAKSIGELGAEAAALSDPPPLEPRHVPVGARDRLKTLERELQRETEKLTAMREKVGAAIAGIADELAALTYEEAQNKRDSVAAAAVKALAGAQLEELRARLAGLHTQIEEATAALELLTNQAGQFGARRMQAEARLADERKRVAPNEKGAVDRCDSLRYRIRQHLARWPELAEARVS